MPNQSQDRPGQGSMKDERIKTDDGEIHLSQAQDGGLRMRVPSDDLTLKPQQARQLIDKAQGFLGGSQGGSQRDRS